MSVRLSTYTHDDVVSARQPGLCSLLNLYIFIQIYLVATDQWGTILLLSCRSQGETTLCETTVKNVVTECLVVEDGRI